MTLFEVFYIEGFIAKRTPVVPLVRPAHDALCMEEVPRVAWQGNDAGALLPGLQANGTFVLFPRV